MKKASIALVLILAVMLVAGIACDGITPCEVCGTYVNQEKPSDFLELEADGTFYNEEGGIGFIGTWEVEGNTITLQLEDLPFATRVTVQGNTIIDPDGERWVKQ
jgi:hypothetical protein